MFCLKGVGELWEAVFPESVLLAVAQNDPDTLDAWAIAFVQTQQAQLQLWQKWLPLLDRLPLPQALAGQIRGKH
ncbi:MAG: hypothetical protein HC890_07215 [Chloroflexaceae bacterium]|nr:hypothetical protein [Chloroflexaceae bacterium]